MKVIICAKRNEAMTRRQFQHHLRHVHWPLVRRHEHVAAAILGYVQNHTLGPDSPDQSAAPYRIATDRDSVIELTFDGEAGLQSLLDAPGYMEEVRPDEGRFNALGQNIMIKTTPSGVFEYGPTGRCKRFDFLARADGATVEAFRDEIERQGEELALNPAYTGIVDAQVHNWRIAQSTDAGVVGIGAGGYKCVREIWAKSFDNLASTTTLFRPLASVDRQTSFSIFATEFVMVPYRV